MCRLFIEAPAELWESRSRSVRLDGVVTTIRIENFFWSALEEIATRDGMSVPGLMTQLYRESVDAGYDIANFASFLRVCAGRYLDLTARGEISDDLAQSLRHVDVAGVLRRESARRRERAASDRLEEALS